MTLVDSRTDTVAVIISQQSGAAVGGFIGDGVQPVPSKATVRIWSWEFIEMVLLGLRDHHV